MIETDKIENFIYGLQQGLYSEVDRRDPQTLQDAMTYAQRAELRSRVRAQYGANHLLHRFSYTTRTTHQSHYLYYSYNYTYTYGARKGRSR